MDGLSGSAWLLWIAAGLLAAVVEVTSLNLVFAMFAGGALVGALAALLGAPFALQVLVFAISSTLMLLAVRPAALRWARRSAPELTTGVAALVGRSARVVQEVTGHGGQVKLAGELWSARAERPDQVLEQGSLVHVVMIDGATAVVAPLPPGERSGGVPPGSEL